MSNTDQTQSKQELRQYIYKQKRLAGEENLLEKSELIIKRLQASPEFQQANHVLTYFALPFEVNTCAAVCLWARSKTVWLPAVEGENLILKRFTSTNELKEGAFGVLEPTGETLSDLSLIDLAIVPGVAFDVKGNRTGYGKGYYDRLLQNLRATKMGICFDFQLFEQIPTSGFDQPVDVILTETRRAPY